MAAGVKSIIEYHPEALDSLIALQYMFNPAQVRARPTAIMTRLTPAIQLNTNLQRRRQEPWWWACCRLMGSGKGGHGKESRSARPVAA